MLEKTEGAIKNEESRDTDNIGHTRHRKSLKRIFHRCFLPSFVHFANRFQRRFKCEKLTEDECQVMAKAHMGFGQVS
jgi:hypothetical protein